MKKITIYEDEKQKIEFAQEGLLVIEEYINSFYKIPPEQIEEILTLIFEKMKLDEDETIKKRILMAAKVPIINKKFSQNLRKMKYLHEIYLFFTQAFNMLESAYEILEKEIDEDWEDKMRSLISTYYLTQYGEECSLFFFGKEESNITGVLTFLEKDDIIILPFKINGENEYRHLT